MANVIQHIPCTKDELTAANAALHQLLLGARAVRIVTDGDVTEWASVYLSDLTQHVAGMQAYHDFHAADINYVFYGGVKMAKPENFGINVHGLWKCNVCWAWTAVNRDSRCESCAAVYGAAAKSPLSLVCALRELAPDLLEQQDKPLQKTCEDLVKINRQLRADRDGLEATVDDQQKKLDAAQKIIDSVSKGSEVVYDLPRAEAVLELQQEVDHYRSRVGELEERVGVVLRDKTELQRKLQEKDRSLDILKSRNMTLQARVTDLEAVTRECLPAYNDSAADWYLDSPVVNRLNESRESKIILDKDFLRKFASKVIASRFDNEPDLIGADDVERLLEIAG